MIGPPKPTGQNAKTKCANEKEPVICATGSLGNACGFNLRTNPLS
jgi:hypothetical protein